MSIFKIIAILILVTSLTVCLAVVRQVFRYNRRYHLVESKYTNLFYYLTIEHVAILYIFLSVIQLIVSVWFLLTI